jgi:gas vesicle protein
MKEGKVALGILAGVAVGAALGILFAPDKGTNTRKNIMHKGEDYADDIKAKMNDLLDTITEKYESIKHEASELVQKGKTKYDEAKNSTV